MTAWTWREVLLSYLFTQPEGATAAQVSRSFPDTNGLPELLELLLAQGHLQRTGRTYRLSAQGEKAVPAAVKGRGKARLTARRFKENLLPSLAVGLEEPASAEELEAALLARQGRLTLQAPGPTRQALFWKLLGQERSEAFTLRAVQLALLEQQLGRRPRDVKAGLRQLATREADVAGDLKQGLRRRFLSTLARVPAAPAGDFASQVREAAQRTTERFGATSVYIAAVHRNLADAALSLEEFKRRLLEAHQRGELRLRAADLVEAMDRQWLAASAVEGPARSVFHFVELEGE